MALKEILQKLGSDEPFYEVPDNTGDLTPDGIPAFNKLIMIQDNLSYINALGKTGQELEQHIKTMLPDNDHELQQILDAINPDDTNTAIQTLILIEDDIEYIDAMGKTGCDLEDYLYEIIRRGR